MYTLQEWLRLDMPTVTRIVASKLSTVVVYLNGTRRWFRSQQKDWADYVQITGQSQRELSQLFYDHGVQTLIQPILGYDLLDRGRDYVKLAMEQGLIEMTRDDYREWYRRNNLRVNLYGNWSEALSEIGLSEVADKLRDLVKETSHHNGRRLLLGVFADGGWDQIISVAKSVESWTELIERYYGFPVDPIDLIVGSGQPAIWDLPLLDINKASLYFLQAPTFCLNQDKLRCILYDHIYERLNDDELNDYLTPPEWSHYAILGIGQRTRKGWIAV